MQFLLVLVKDDFDQAIRVFRENLIVGK